LLTASGALLGRSLAAEEDDGVVVEPVGLRSVAASRVVGIALGMLLRCTRPAVTVAPERHAVDVAEAAGRLLCSLGDRLLLAGQGRRPLVLRLSCWPTPSGAIAALVFRISPSARLDVAVRRRRSLAGGAFAPALALAAESGRRFPVAKCAAADAHLGAELSLPASRLAGKCSRSEPSRAYWN
jgi:hypothetical protein